MASSSTAMEAVPPWLELPREITAAILQKLGAIGMLTTAGKVCMAWRSVCRDPSMWRCIDMRCNRPKWRYFNMRCPPGDVCDREKRYNMEKMCRHAVDLSQGQLIDINIENFGSKELLHYISQRSSQLRRLQLVISYNVYGEDLAEAVKNIPQLEELHLYYISIGAKDIEAIGRSCPLLKSFKLNDRYGYPGMVCDLEARAIAENMPELRHLQLFGNKMSNEGLRAIIDGCPYLESLDIRKCFNVHFEGDIQSLCSQRFKDLRLPHDPRDDY